MDARLAVAVAAAILAVACAGGQRVTRGGDAGVRTAHVDVGADPTVECATCHSEVTPAAVRDWSNGPHGVALVKCFVCHGSTGPDFAARPQPARCEGCHPAEAASVAGPPATSCFSCHPHHALLPQGKPDPHHRQAGT